MGHDHHEVHNEGPSTKKRLPTTEEEPAAESSSTTTKEKPVAESSSNTTTTKVPEQSPATKETSLAYNALEDYSIHKDKGEVGFIDFADEVSTELAYDKPVKRYFKNKLPNHIIRKDVRVVIERKEIPEAVLKGLTPLNYSAYFRTLYNIEELRIEEYIKAYDMECVPLKRNGRYFLVRDVTGLAERRPSLVQGDSVFVQLASDDYQPREAYKGCIHRVMADGVSLQFTSIFPKRHKDGNLYNVRFGYNRVNFKRLYQAIDCSDKLHKEILFPTESGGKRVIAFEFPKPISHDINLEQAMAVRLILGCKGGAPYVIHWLPGIGKTKTLVEAILQLYKNKQKSRILVCAYSNCAVDHILEKIIGSMVDVKEKEIFRLNASSRPFEDVDPYYLKFCVHEEGVFRCPCLRKLSSYMIILTTYVSASSLYAEGVNRGHFSHIILDDAGQASEPETMIPISNLGEEDTLIVLAGDPMQLGHVIYSKVAESYGLGKSYLERLIECDVYRSGDPNYVAVLVKNYRSHYEILSVPSTLFYKGTLIPYREESEASSLPWADFLLNPNFPVMFFGIQGLDEMEGSTPSWFNRFEATKVVDLVMKLVSRNVPEHDIGVITPHRQQVMKITMALEDRGIRDIKIGNVEQFQGEEREVIIVSTVKSTVKHNDFDKTFCLGFLSNPKRSNVAMNRAKSLLVIIGNPYIIEKDWHWKQMLRHCIQNKSYQGCALLKQLDP